MALTKNQLRTLAGIPTTSDGNKPLQEAVQINETAEYEDSADFTHAMETAKSLLKQFDEIVSSEKFKKWVEVTEQNFDVDVVNIHSTVLSHLEELKDSFRSLDEEFDEAA